MPLHFSQSFAVLVGRMICGYLMPPHLHHLQFLPTITKHEPHSTCIIMHQFSSCIMCHGCFIFHGFHVAQISNAKVPCQIVLIFFRGLFPGFHHRGQPRRCRTSTSVTAHRRIASRWGAKGSMVALRGDMGKSQDFGASNNINYLGITRYNMVYLITSFLHVCSIHLFLCFLDSMAFGFWLEFGMDCDMESPWSLALR